MSSQNTFTCRDAGFGQPRHVPDLSIEPFTRNHFNCSVRNFIPLSEARLGSGLSSADKCEVIGVNHVKSSSLSIITY